MDIEKIKQDIIKKLEPLNLDKVVLFGSYAYGAPHKDSDIDLIVHSKKMHEVFKETNGSFFRNDISRGVALI